MNLRSGTTFSAIGNSEVDYIDNPMVDEDRSASVKASSENRAVSVGNIGELPRNIGMISPAQFFLPTLKSLDVEEMKHFMIEYQALELSLGSEVRLKQPRQLVPIDLLQLLLMQLKTDKTTMEAMSSTEFFDWMFGIHHARTVVGWKKQMETIHMSEEISMSGYFLYVQKFNRQCVILGKRHAPSEKERVKVFIRGVQPESVRAELFAHVLEDMSETSTMAMELLENYLTSLEFTSLTFKSRGKQHFKSHHGSSVPTNGTVSVKAASDPVEVYTPKSKNKDHASSKALTCYKCLQTGHIAPKCPNVKHPNSTWVEHHPKSSRRAVVRAFVSDASDLVESKDDGFIRLPMKIGVGLSVDSGFEGEYPVFCDCGANINTVTRDFLCNVPGVMIIPGTKTSVKMIGKTSLPVSGDEVDLTLQVQTKVGPVTTLQ